MRKTTLMLMVGLGLTLGCGNCGGKDEAPAAAAVEADQGPIVSVSIMLPDEEAAAVEMRLVKPFERALRGDEQVKEFWSTVVAEQATIYTRYQPNVADSLALDLTQRALERVRRTPESASEPELAIAEEPTGLQVRLKSSNMDALIDAAGAVSAQISQLDGVDGVSSSLQTRPSIDISYSEEKVRAVGMRTFGVAQQVKESGLLDAAQPDPEAIGALQIKTRDGAELPLSELAVVTHSVSATRLDCFNGKRVAWLTVSGADEAALRDQLQEIRSPHNAVTVSLR